MSTKLITLDDEAPLSVQLQRLHLPFSEYSFANIFLFRHVHEYTFDTDAIYGKSYDGQHFAMPLTDLRDSPLLKPLQADFFYPVSEQWLASFKPGTFQASFKEEDSDYLYHVDTFKYYPGRHLDGRRNLVHQLESHYEIRSVPIQNVPQSDLIAILEGWEAQSHQHTGFSDVAVCREAFSLLQRLKLIGVVVYCDNNPAGFVIGEQSAMKTFIVHFIKANYEYKGIFQYLYQALARSLDPLIEWMNLEQDLGDEGLRRSKEAYHPDQHLKKMRLVPVK